MPSLPSQQDCIHLLVMLETGLVNYRYTHPWADELIQSLESPPFWLCDLSAEKYKGAQIKAIQDALDSVTPDDSPMVDLTKFGLACLWVQYENRGISWATFLGSAGGMLDSAGSDWACEVPYHYLNLYEEAYFSLEAEERLKLEYLNEQDLRPWIEEARTSYQWFLKYRANKSQHPTASS